MVVFIVEKVEIVLAAAATAAELVFKLFLS